MKLNSRFNVIFPKIPIIGMIHLAGEDPVSRALEEISIYEKQGVNGALIENYHNHSLDVLKKVLHEVSNLERKIIIGVNVLPNEFHRSLSLANVYNADFVQLDFVAGKYKGHDFSFDSYSAFKEAYPNIVVLGGVWPKYYTPVDNSNLENDIKEGMERAEAVVVTGEATGVEIPLEKIITFKRILGSHPLIVGAGLNLNNVYSHLSIADGAIVGSYFKPNGDTSQKVDETLVSEFMNHVKKLRFSKGD